MDNNFDVNKYINAVLYFASNEDLGITKLNKLMYYSDFIHYKEYLRSIFGDQYVKMKRGPVPEKSYNIFNANFRDGEDDKLKDFFDVNERKLFDFSRKEIQPKQEANLDHFSESEIEIMEKVQEKFKGYTADDISEQSHDEIPWNSVDLYDEISYLSILNNDDDQQKQEYAKYKNKTQEDLNSVLTS